jgi:hypothetical protein
MCSLSIARDFRAPYFVLPSVLFIVLPISPSFVLPSVSKASFTSFGTALRDGIKSKLRVTAEVLAQKHF